MKPGHGQTAVPQLDGVSEESRSPAPHPIGRLPMVQAESVESSQAVRSSPLVRRIAKVENVDLSDLEGTGFGGRITKKDILSYLTERQKVAEVTRPMVQQVAQDVAETRQSRADRTEVVPMSAMRKSIAEHMVASRRISAHVTTVFEVDISRIAQLKNQHAQDFLNKEGIKLSYMPFFIRITSEGLKEFPMLNASIVGHQHHLQERHQHWCCRRPGLGAHRARDQKCGREKLFRLGASCRRAG